MFSGAFLLALALGEGQSMMESAFSEPFSELQLSDPDEFCPRNQALPKASRSTRLNSRAGSKELTVKRRGKLAQATPHDGSEGARVGREISHPRREIPESEHGAPSHEETHEGSDARGSAQGHSEWPVREVEVRDAGNATEQKGMAPSWPRAREQGSTGAVISL